MKSTWLTYLCIPEAGNYIMDYSNMVEDARMSPRAKKSKSPKSMFYSDTVVYSGAWDYRINLLQYASSFTCRKSICEQINKDRRWDQKEVLNETQTFDENYEGSVLSKF